MIDPRTYTCEELEALPIGTIVVVHDEPNNTVWRVFLSGRIEMISHSGIPVKYLSDFAVDGEGKGHVKHAPELSVIGIQANAYQAYKGTKENE